MIPSLEPGERVLCVGFSREKLCIEGAVVVVRDPRDPQRLIVKRVSKVGAHGDFEVVGDNLGVSTDSRHFGSISRDGYEGRAVVIYWPKFRWLGASR